jgi:hypothetical protein
MQLHRRRDNDGNYDKVDNDADDDDDNNDYAISLQLGSSRSSGPPREA